MASESESSRGVERQSSIFGSIQKEVISFKDGLTMSGGDWGSLCQLFFDNLSTLLGALFAVQNMAGFGVPTDVIDDIIWGKVVPGVGITLVIGNIYYSWQAIRLTNKYGRQYTAQPYGLNTPAAFAFIFNIWYTVYFEKSEALGPSEAFITAYKVTLAANFITGLIATFLGFFGRAILKTVPPAALLVPIAGIGIAFLGLEQISNSIAAPLVGYSAIMWVYLGWYAGVKIGYGKYRIPEAVMVILVGVALGWATKLNKGSDVKDASKLVKWWGPTWSADELFADFNLVKDYLGIIIPIGISAASSTLMCLVSAKEAGDPFPVHESMISDGIGTMLASFFGSPFGTVLYIGHPAHKRSGAKVGYSLVNGFIYLFLSWFGLLALIQSLVNQATIGPIVFFVGLMINEEALNFMPSRHYAAYLIGLFPSIYDWVTNITGRAPLSSAAANGELYNNNFPVGNNGFIGVLAWKRGALLVSMVWVAMAVKVIDRQWMQATLWAGIAAAFALFGIIHVPEAGFETFTEPTWEQCWGIANAEDIVEMPTCWDHAEQWMFFVSYIMLAATFGIIYVVNMFDKEIEDPIIDESTHAFQDWFKDASKGPPLEDSENSDVSDDDKDDDVEKPEVVPDEVDGEGKDMAIDA